MGSEIGRIEAKSGAKGSAACKKQVEEVGGDVREIGLKSPASSLLDEEKIDQMERWEAKSN